MQVITRGAFGEVAVFVRDAQALADIDHDAGAAGLVLDMTRPFRFGGNTLAKVVHQGREPYFGIVAEPAGLVQYRNLYAGGRDDNPCVSGNAWPRQEACSGTPWAHLAGGLVAGGLYWTTFGYSLRMPDPDHAARLAANHEISLAIYDDHNLIVVGLCVKFAVVA